ncbi:baseplate J/gp47 family protein [Saccharibacter floricola]|uniref:Baseplate protein J-like barrel domain-containing protein n=1 Tax=Saccharibacter floricola DSM 15669 TaxID=1123227 RepID=A0ABQ0NZY0_9PROT|nr:baseplate J/gp47 family protein [Saccharibacter floricola]GBQ07533.1 hypothetical protein AA15669_1424 [Saccharibacter floricola DSM 15669]
MAIIDLTDAQLSVLEERYPGLLTTLNNSGVQPTDPQTLRDRLIATATTRSPGVTTDLPGTLTEDMASTAIGALAQIDQAKVDLINSVSPLNATPAFLDEFGEVYGVKRGAGANPSAYVTFTGPPGLYLAAGFQVSDGIYTYETQENYTIPANGVLPQVYVLSLTEGTTIIPENSITTIVTGLAAGINLSVTNPVKGTAGTGSEKDSDYRARILQAGQRTAQGTPGFIRSCLLNVPNVLPRSIRVNVLQDRGYSIMVDGGDPNQIAGAIYTSCFDLPSLQPSINPIANATRANPCVIASELTHGLTDGQTVTIAGETAMTSINGSFTASVIDASHFSIPVDTTNAPLYSGNGVLQTNPRDLAAFVSDGPDRYEVAFIRPLQQKVKLSIRWQTNNAGVVDDSIVTQAIAPQLSNYINSLTVGAPLSTLQMGTITEAALLQLLPGATIASLSFTVFLDGLLSSPPPNSVIIEGDPQSYFITSPDQITLERDG